MATERNQSSKGNQENFNRGPSGNSAIGRDAVTQDSGNLNDTTRANANLGKSDTFEQSGTDIGESDDSRGNR